MLAELPENTLITADAGFMGYEFWRAVMEAGHSFVIRAGANVRLLKKLGYAREYDQTIYLWPKGVAKKELPPLVLRVVWVHDGKQAMCLVTNVRSKAHLSDRQIVDIYKARWGVELFFRTFKQTFGRHKLRSHAGKNAQLEIDWSLVGLWSVCLLAQRELVQAGEGSASTEPRGCDQGDSAGDASLPHPAGQPRRNPLGDASLCVARRLPKKFIEDGSQLSEEEETRANRSSHSHRRIHTANRCGTRT